MERAQYLWLILIGACCLQIGCGSAEVNFDELRRTQNVAKETAYDVEIFYSDSSKLKVKVSGPVSNRYTTGYVVEEEFPDGVEVEFYGPDGEVMSWLIADYAIRKEKEKKIFARGNVLLRNVEDKKLEGSELIWDERTREIYSDRFVKITQGEEIIYSHTFRSDESFKEMELSVIEGEMLVEQLSENEN